MLECRFSDIDKIMFLNVRLQGRDNEIFSVLAGSADLKMMPAMEVRLLLGVDSLLDCQRVIHYEQ